MSYYVVNRQDFLNPDFSLARQDSVKHLKVFLFDKAALTKESEKDVKFLKKSGERYDVITSAKLDSVYAIIDSSQPSQTIQMQLGKLLGLQLDEALGIERF